MCSAVNAMYLQSLLPADAVVRARLCCTIREDQLGTLSAPEEAAEGTPNQPSNSEECKPAQPAPGGLREAPGGFKPPPGSSGKLRAASGKPR